MPARHNITYLMHVDWRWIRQRPHILAEELQHQGFDVAVAYRQATRKSLLVEEPPRRPLTGFSGFRLLPNRPAFDGWNDAMLRAYGRRLLLNAPTGSWLWVTHPMFWPLARAWPGRVVYDAMDIASAFPRGDATRLRQNESALVAKAAVVIASSERIREHLHEVYGRQPERILLARNGLDERELPVQAGSVAGSGPITYFGTLGEWLDWGSLIAALDMAPQAVIRCIGPAETVPPLHPRLQIEPAIPRTDLMQRVRDDRALLLPFQDTPLVRGVDPVKMYEYVALGLPIIARRYPGVEHFRPFAHFYDTPQEFARLVTMAMRGNLKVAEYDKRRKFLKSNTWAERARIIADAMSAVA